MHTLVVNRFRVKIRKKINQSKYGTINFKFSVRLGYKIGLQFKLKYFEFSYGSLANSFLVQIKKRRSYTYMYQPKNYVQFSMPR